MTVMMTVTPRNGYVGYIPYSFVGYMNAWNHYIGGYLSWQFYHWYFDISYAIRRSRFAYHKYETIDKLWEDNRVLFFNRMEDYSSNPNLGMYWRQNTAQFSFRIHDSNSYLFGKQILVTFDVESYNSNEVQLFVGGVLHNTYEVRGRQQFGVVLDVIDSGQEYWPYYVSAFLRPANKKGDIYVYSAKVSLIE